jgi:hypothetical protein
MVLSPVTGRPDPGFGDGDAEADTDGGLRATFLGGQVVVAMVMIGQCRATLDGLYSA